MESSQRLKQGDVTISHVRIHPCHDQEPLIMDADRIFNHVIHGSSENMTEIPDQSVHLTVTSPPYNVGKPYEQGESFEDWLSLMRDVFAEVIRVTVPGGRVCININGMGRSPYIPLQYHLTGIMMNLGFFMRGDVIWNKGASVGSSTAWGSWRSATNPVLRDVHEHVLVFAKESFDREQSGSNTITKDDFLQCTRSIWDMPTESARRIGHPAPFPVELPRRLIELYSFAGDVVLDPFCGSGSACVAAVMTGRRYVGFDLVPEYVELARKRIEDAQASL